MVNHFTVWMITNCGKFIKRWEYQITLLASSDICMQVKKQQLELDMKGWTGSKLEKSTSRLYIVTLYEEYIMGNTGLDETQAGIKIVRRNINNLRYAGDTIKMAEREEELKSHLMRVRGLWFEFNVIKTKIMASCPIAL